MHMQAIDASTACMGVYKGYTTYEGPKSHNQITRKLGYLTGSGREATPTVLVILINIRENGTMMAKRSLLMS